MKKGIVLCALLTAFSLSAQEIPQWRGDRTGIYRETGLLKQWPAEGPALLWHYDGLGEGFSSVSIASGKIYVTGLSDGKGTLTVLDMQGKPLRKVAYGDEWEGSYPGARGTATIHEGKVYLVTGTGSVICFSESDLSVLWRKEFGKDFGGETPRYGVHESPLIIGDKLIVTPGGSMYNIVALNKNTGELIWHSPAKGDISSYCSAMYAADQQVPQIITMTGHNIVGIDVSNGRLLWSFPFTNRFFEHPNTPVYENGMVLCTSSYGVGSVMLRLVDGGRKVEQAWASVNLDVRTGHMVKIGDYAYGAGDYGKGSWYCVDWKTGREMYKDRSMATGVTIAADGMLYCYSEKGDLALVRINSAKFDVASRFNITLGTAQHWAHPVISGGVLYVRHGDTLMAYKIK